MLVPGRRRAPRRASPPDEVPRSPTTEPAASQGPAVPARRQAPAGDEAVGPAELQHLGTTAGNQAVQRLLRTRRGGPPSPGTTAVPSVQRWTMPWLTRKSNAELIRDGIAGDTNAIGEIKDFSPADENQRMQMVDHLLDQVYVGPIDAGALERIWTSFGTGFVEVASRHLQLWRRSTIRHTGLPNAVPPARDLRAHFVADVKAVGERNLRTNRQFALDRMRHYGIPENAQGPQPELTGDQSGQLARLQVAAEGLGKLQFALEAAPADTGGLRAAQQDRLLALLAAGTNLALDASRFQALATAAETSATPGTEMVERRAVDEARMATEADTVAFALALLALGAAARSALNRIRNPQQVQDAAADARKRTGGILDPGTGQTVVRREITTLTNVNAEMAASDVLPRYNPGSGFSGAYNPATRQWVAVASGDASLVSGQPVQTVPQFGGHAAAESALVARSGVADTSKNVGFVMIWEGNGKVSVRWNSATINQRNFGNRAAPVDLRPQIKQAIEATTGFQVVE